MNEAQALAQPQEFNEALLGAQAQIPGAIPGGRRGGKKILGAPAEEPGVQIYEPSHEAPVPSIPFRIKTATGEKTVMIKDKRQIFTIPLDDLRSRWHDVCVRPNSGSVRVYDKAGGLLCRFVNWEQAATVFKQAGILDAVKARMKKLEDERIKREDQARKDALQNKKAA